MVDEALAAWFLSQSEALWGPLAPGILDYPKRNNALERALERMRFSYVAHGLRAHALVAIARYGGTISAMPSFASRFPCGHGSTKVAGRQVK